MTLQPADRLAALTDVFSYYAMSGDDIQAANLVDSVVNEALLSRGQALKEDHPDDAGFPYHWKALHARKLLDALPASEAPKEGPVRDLVETRRKLWTYVVEGFLRANLADAIRDHADYLLVSAKVRLSEAEQKAFGGILREAFRHMHSFRALVLREAIMARPQVWEPIALAKMMNAVLALCLPHEVDSMLVREK